MALGKLRSSGLVKADALLRNAANWGGGYIGHHYESPPSRQPETLSQVKQEKLGLVTIYGKVPRQ
jgi:hypothetical protein